MPSQFSLEQAPLLFLVFVRTTALLMATPPFAHRSVPAMVKVGLGLTVAFVLVQVYRPATGDLPPVDSMAYLFAVAGELAAGLLMALVASIVFAGLQAGAQIVGFQMGFGLPSAVDPLYAGQSQTVEQLYGVLAALVFLAINGHHQVLLALARSLEVLPPGAFHLPLGGPDALAELSAELLSIGLRLAIPLAGALLLAEIALGLLARAVPQMNVFLVGMPARIGLGLLVFLGALPLIVVFMGEVLKRVPAEMLAMAR